MKSGTEVVNLYACPERVQTYIGRKGSVPRRLAVYRSEVPGSDGYFGNPYPVSKHGEQALPLFAHYFRQRIVRDREYRERVLGLRGQVLGCFCKPKPCHGDVILQWLDARCWRPMDPAPSSWHRLCALDEGHDGACADWKGRP